MILFDLKCTSGHVFEAWFRDSVNFDVQAEAGEITCPYCGDDEISKAPMAPSLAGTGTSTHDATGREASADDLPLTGPCAPDHSQPESVVGLSEEKVSALVKEVAGKLGEFRSHIETECDYVGEEFTEEARKIHYGEAEERGIYGEATESQTEELAEEGVEFFKIPWARRRDS
ncbi:MAG: DUF1178 family protein [Alphaproteobacteria bacterium]|nr:DUF1178 family protein [Alphaproteobacteria bacterium]